MQLSVHKTCLYCSSVLLTLTLGVLQDIVRIFVGLVTSSQESEAMLVFLQHCTIFLSYFKIEAP